MKTINMKKTAIAPSNIAFIKYWGKKDTVFRLPTHSSISMNLSNLLTTTTVEFNHTYKKDEVMINGKQDEKEIKKVVAHLDRIRKKAKIQTGSNYDSKGLWSGTFRYSNKQCRPGGANASVYDLSNGAKFCLYFDNH